MKNKRIFKTFSAPLRRLGADDGPFGDCLCPGDGPAPGGGHHKRHQCGGGGNRGQSALTPDGNAALVDDFGGNKQLITVTTKAGKLFLHPH